MLHISCPNSTNRPVLKACNFFKETQETPTQRFLYFDYNQSSLLCYYKNFFNLNFCLHCRCFSRNFAKLFRLVFYWAYLDVCIKLSLYHMPPSITLKIRKPSDIRALFRGSRKRPVPWNRLTLYVCFAVYIFFAKYKKKRITSVFVLFCLCRNYSVIYERQKKKRVIFALMHWHLK